MDRGAFASFFVMKILSFNDFGSRRFVGFMLHSYIKVVC